MSANDHADVPDALCELVGHLTSNEIQLLENIVTNEVPLAFPVNSERSSSNDESTIVNNDDLVIRKEISSYLYEFIRSRHSIAEFSWIEVLTHISRFPEQVKFTDETNGRTPLHVTCLALGESEAPPLSVISSFLELFPQAAYLPDAAGNLPIHLVFSHFSSRENSPSNDVIELFLKLRSGNKNKNYNHESQRKSKTIQSVVSRRNKNGCTVLDLACDNKDISPDIIQTLVLAYDSNGTTDETSKSSEITETSTTLADNTPIARYATAGGTNMSAIRLLMDKFPHDIQRKNQDNETILHRPAFYGNINFVESILLRDDSWDVQDLGDKRNRTPLHRACQGTIPTSETHPPNDNNMLAVVELLLEHFPETALMTDEPHGRTPLHYACLNKKPSIDIITSLLYVSRDACRVADRNGYTPLHYVCANTEGEKYLIVKALLENFPLATWMQTKRGDTPLHLASEYQHQHDSADIVKSLVEFCPDAMDIQNNYGFNPLHCACRRYEPSLVEFNILLSHKDHLPRTLFQCSHNGDLPFHMAVSNPRTPISIIKLLFEMYQKYHREDHNDSTILLKDGFQNKLGNNPLHIASYQNHTFEFMSMLTSLSPQWVLQRNGAGYSPLHICCKSGKNDIRIFETMLQTANKKSNYNNIDILMFRDEEGHAPIHSACSTFSQSSDLVSLLANECPDAVTMKTKSGGDLPLHLACARHAPFFVTKALVDIMTRKSIENIHSGSILPTLLLEQKNQEGFTALDILIARYMSLNRPIFHILRIEQNNEEKTQLHRELMYLIRRMVYCDRIQRHHGQLLLELDDSEQIPCSFANDQLSNEFVSPDLHTCLNLRQKLGAGSIPSLFLKQILLLDVGKVREKDPYDGNYPLHLACNLIEPDVVEESCSDEVPYDIIRHLLSAFPEAASKRINGKFPLDILMEKGSTWITGGVYQLLRSYPPAMNLMELGNATNKKCNGDFLIPHVLNRVAEQGDLSTLFRVILSAPDLFNQNNTRQFYLFKKN